MEQIKLNKTLYSKDLVCTGIKDFEEHASFIVDENADYWLIKTDDVYALLELCNYLMGGIQ